MVKVYEGARGERGPIGTQVNLTLSEGASTDIDDRPAVASDGATWALLGDGVTTFYVWENGGWTDAGSFTDAQILGAGAKLYTSIADGLANTSNGGLFLLQTGPGTAVYQNIAGDAKKRGWLGELLYDDVDAIVQSEATNFEPGVFLRTRREGIAHVVAPPAAQDAHVINQGGVKLYETGLLFTSRERFEQAVARGESYQEGRIVAAGTGLYVFANDGNTDLPGLPGWRILVAPDLEARLAALEGVVTPEAVAEVVNEYLEEVTNAKSAAKQAASEAEDFRDTAAQHKSAANAALKDTEAALEKTKELEESAQSSADLAENAKEVTCSKLADVKILVGEAELARDKSREFKQVAEAARDAATLGATGVYGTLASGVANTSDGERFLFAGSDGWSLYENSGGSESKVSGDFPSLSRLNALFLENIRGETVSQSRPGELLQRFSDAREGSRTSGSDPDAQIETAMSPYGQAIDVGPSKIVAMRDRIWLDQGKQIAIRGVFKIQNNTCDPEGETVTLGVEWLDADYTSIGSEILFDEVVWESDGWQDIERVVTPRDEELLYRSGINSKFDPNWDDPRWFSDDGILECPPEEDPNATEPAPDPGPYPEPWVTPPEGASYLVAYIQTNGNDGTTRIALLDAAPTATQVSAERITYPLGFVFPDEVIPGNRLQRTIFVAQHGDNSENGRSLKEAVRDVERACELADQDDCVKYSIQVWPGEYETSGHIDVPDNVSEVAGMSGQRSARFYPSQGNSTKNVFRLGNGGMIRNLSGEGWQVDDHDDPTEGFLAVFRPDAFIARTCYVDHCVMYRAQEPAAIPLPLDPEFGNPMVPKGPGIAMADGKVANPNSPFPQIMVEASTTSTPNGIGYCAKNNAFVNTINVVSIWPHKHFLALDGGQLLLNGCATQFGDYSLWSQGSMPVIEPDPSPGPLEADSAAAATVDANRQPIIDAMWAETVNQGYANVNEEFSRRDANNLVTAIQYDLTQGVQESTEIFLRGLFPAGVFVAPSSKIPAFVAGFQGMRGAINGLGISATSKDMAKGLIDLVTNTVQNPNYTFKPSLISATSHNWDKPYGGVNRRAFVRPVRQVPDTIVELDLGQVVFSGLDDNGKQYFTGGALVNPITGMFEGPPVDRTIMPRATRAGLIASQQG
jgi:hypothetical protein